MTYQEAIRYLESFIDYEKIPAYPYSESLKLERIKEFLETVGNPQEFLRCIHVAGTKGKGSTCAFIAYILRQSGYRVGLYTSPHLSDFEERIRILEPQAPEDKKNNAFEGKISSAKLKELIERIKPAIEKYSSQSKYGDLTFFEVCTALAFEYFKEHKVDFAVLETGLGGRLDSTNVVDPLICLITHLSLEHTQKLGSTLEEIAQEKAGIIKARTKNNNLKELIVITAPQAEGCLRVIRNKCHEEKALLYEVGKDINFEKTNKGFNIKGTLGTYFDLEIRVLGNHQIINAALATAAIEALGLYGIKISAECIKEGLYNALWPGRCEVVSHNPLVVLDGAQNPASARVLKQAVKNNFKYKKLILVLGISQDKDIPGICDEFREFSDKIILTKSNNPRASSIEALAAYFKGKQGRAGGSVTEAVKIAIEEALPEDLILITGSLFVVGEARGLFIKY